MNAGCRAMPLELIPPRAREHRPARGHWKDVLDHIILPARRDAPWNNYYDQLTRLLHWKIRRERDFVKFAQNERIPRGALRVVEIGTMYGGASERMLQQLESIELYVIDPFLGGFPGLTKEASVDNGGTSFTNASHMNVLRSWGLDAASLSHAWARGIAHDFRSRFGCRAHVFHNFSLAVAPVFDDESVDIVFVDGLHTFEALTADLHAWWPKLAADGGVMILNDYNSNLREARHPGVYKAAKAFFGNTTKICVGAHQRPPGHRNAWVLKGTHQCGYTGCRGGM